MSAMNQWVRVIGIDRRIRLNEYPNAQSLSDALGITSRLIYRDCDKLRKMGAPIAYDRKRRGWYYRDPTWILPWGFMTEGELLAFFLSVEIARTAGNTGFGDSLSRIIDKIAAIPGAPVSIDLNELRDATSFGLLPAARVDAKNCQMLCSAQSRRRKVQMHYFTAHSGESKTRIVHPYHVRWRNGEWYLLAWDERRHKTLWFNIARIKELELLDEPFNIDRTFNLDTYLRTMFGAEAGDTTHQISVWFDAYQARYINERDWHPDETRQNLPDGALILSFPASGLPEVARWVLGYGRHARVLQPPELVSLVRDHLQAMLPQYEPDALSTPTTSQPA